MYVELVLTMISRMGGDQIATGVDGLKYGIWYTENSQSVIMLQIKMKDQFW
jgi:hypothetical protein